uniref:Uncharacterized protein n=1 Tax=Solanum lycopersicum TaxID=4081 RepID=A0A3Q7J6P3_SOLLC
MGSRRNDFHDEASQDGFQRNDFHDEASLARKLGFGGGVAFPTIEAFI